MDCVMGSPDTINILFSKIDLLVEAQGKTALEIEGLRSDVRVLASEMKYKAEKSDIVNDIQLHSMECQTRRPTGFWSGMTVAQKSTMVTTVITAIVSGAVLIIQNLN